MKLDYLLLDVFTRERLSGNQLAIVLKADGLSDKAMQNIAREFNLSETVFLNRPFGVRNAASLRIFTPSHELPFAGHPTIGTAVALGLMNKLSAVRLEEKIGLISVLFERLDRRCGEARFNLPSLPVEMGASSDRFALALALGIEPDDIGGGYYKPAVYSAGNVFHLVPVRSAEILARIVPNYGAWGLAFPHGDHAAYVFCETPEEPENDLAARMFEPGIGEDPGTGSAAAALIGLLATHAPLANGQVEYRLRQGVEMGRPCQIKIQLRLENDVLVQGAIGGHAIMVGQGVLDLAD